MKFNDFANSKRKIKIGFLGGSITAGSGASKEEFCWRYRVTEELSKLYPGTEFEGIHAAIGGTGSDLGLFRMDNDMMQYDPDMVFVEFAVNDCDLHNTDMYMENIVRKILRKDKNIPIIFIYTVTQRMIDEGYGKGELPASVIKQNTVADYYGIPTINVGKVLFDKITEEGCDIKRYTIDTVHPNDDGYDVYTGHIMQQLPELEFNIDFKEQVLTRDIPNPRMILAEVQEGWRKSVNKMYRTLPGYIFTYHPGRTLKFEFEGSIIGLYFTMEKDSGNIEYSIDGGETRLCRTWDKFCKQFNRDNNKILDDTLEYGKHTLEITVSESREKDSEGRYIRIGAYLVG